jgi:hypothetical protein
MPHEEENAIKANARYSAADMRHLQAIHDACKALGADCGMDEAAAVKAAKRNSAADMADIQGMHDTCKAHGASCEAGAGCDMGDMAVKSLGGDRIGAYAVIFGDENHPDITPIKDYYTKATDFWLDAWDKRPMIYNHAMDQATTTDPVIGEWTKALIDDKGVWLEGELRKAHAYHQYVKRLIEAGVLALSSDSAPHLIKRTPMPNGTHRVDRWPLLAASLTPTPAEPRLLPVATIKAAYKAIGVDWSDTSDSGEGATSTGEQQRDDTARRLLLELDLLELECQP